MKILLFPILDLLQRYPATFASRIPIWSKHPDHGKRENEFRQFLTDLRNHVTSENYLNDQKLFELVGRLTDVIDSSKQKKGSTNNFRLLRMELAEIIGYDVLSAARTLKSRNCFNVTTFHKETLPKITELRQAYSQLLQSLSTSSDIIVDNYRVQVSKIDSERSAINDSLASVTTSRQNLATKWSNLVSLSNNARRVVGTERV